MSALPRLGSSERSRVIRLGALLLVLALALAYRYWPATESRPASDGTPGARTPGVEPPGILPLPQDVRLRALDSPPDLADTTRNPFTFGVRPAPSPPPETPMPPRMDPPPPPRPQGPPPIALRLMGVTVIPGDGRSLVTLKEPSTNGLYQAFEGDIVDGRFRVVRVGLQSVVLSYLDGSGTRTIPLGG